MRSVKSLLNMSSFTGSNSVMAGKKTYFTGTDILVPKKTSYTGQNIVLPNRSNFAGLINTKGTPPAFSISALLGIGTGWTDQKAIASKVQLPGAG